jgi:hypothetical protein
MNSHPFRANFNAAGPNRRDAPNLRGDLDRGEAPEPNQALGVRIEELFANPRQGMQRHVGVGRD